jgi:hypothetical protein
MGVQGQQREGQRRGFLLPPGQPGKVVRPSWSASEPVRACAAPMENMSGTRPGTVAKGRCQRPLQSPSCVRASDSDGSPARPVVVCSRSVQCMTIAVSTSPTSPLFSRAQPRRILDI